MSTRHLRALMGAVFALVLLSAPGVVSSAFASGCEDEETATEECVIDDYAVGGTQPSGVTAPSSSEFADRGAPAATAAASPIAPPIPKPTLRIWTDRKVYSLGDMLKVCFRVPGPGQIQIVDAMPDGFRQVLWSWYDDGTGDCQYAYITPPTGTECLILRYEFSPRDYYPMPFYDGPGGVSPAVSPPDRAVPAMPVKPRYYFAKTCFQTRDYWDPMPVDFIMPPTPLPVPLR